MSPGENFKHAINVIFSEVTYNSKPALKSCVAVYHYMNTSGLTAEKLEAAVKKSTSAGGSAGQLVFGMYKSFIISESGIDAQGMFHTRKQFYLIYFLYQGTFFYKATILISASFQMKR